MTIMNNLYHTCSVLFEHVPYIAIKVIISAEEQASTLGEGHRCDTTDDVVVGVHADLLVCPDIEQAARGVIRPRSKCRAIREILQKTISR